MRDHQGREPWFPGPKGTKIALAGVSVLALVLAAILAVVASRATTSSGRTPNLSDSAAPTLTQTSTSTNLPDTSSQAATVTASGFGREGKSAWVTAIVKNTSGKAGQFVTVNFNLQDSRGEIVVSESQVESFSWPDQEMAIGTLVDLGSTGTDVVSVEAVANVTDYGSEPTLDRYQVGPGRIAQPDYPGGSYKASFEVTNPSSRPITEARIGVVCLDDSDRVIGGGSIYPNLVPARGSIRASTEVLVGSQAPSRCIAFAG